MKNKQRGSDGSVLVYALVVILVGAVILASWMSLMGTRVLYTEQMAAAINRRITLENSRALASQYILKNVLGGSFSSAPSFNFSAVSGSFGLASLSLTQTPLESTSIQTAVNHFAPGCGAGFTVNISGTLSDGTNAYSWLFQAKSRSPQYSGDLLTVQKPTLVAGNIVVTAGFSVGGGISGGANTVLWQPNSPSSYTSLFSRSYQTPTVTLPTASLLLSGVSTLLMSDFAFLPVTSGTAGSNFGYDGSISVVHPTGLNPPNSLYSHVTTLGYITATTSGSGTSAPGVGVTCVSGTVTIDLSQSSLSGVYIAENAKTIVLQGQVAANDVTADGLTPVLIQYAQTTSGTYDLTSLVLQGYNNRRIYLGVQKNTIGAATSLVVTSTSAGSPVAWRMGGAFENTPLTFTLGGKTLQITGGLRTDGSLAVTSDGGAVQFSRETTPKLLERYADRLAWLESFRQ